MNYINSIGNRNIFTSSAARYYNSDLSIWLSVDPLADKYPNLSPYTYCAGNPVRLVDENGRAVITTDQASRENIQNTLSEYENQYLKFDRDGRLDVEYLNNCQSTSENFTALKSLAQSDITYLFSTASEYSNSGKNEILVGEQASGTTGVTLLPGAQVDPSPDNNVHIIVSNLLGKEKQASTTAHEAYGHAYFYDLKMHGKNVNPYHNYQPVFLGMTFDENLNIEVATFGRQDMNIELATQIKIVENQAINNYRMKTRK